MDNQKQKLSSFAKFAGIVTAASAMTLLVAAGINSEKITPYFANRGAVPSFAEFGEQVAERQLASKKGRIVGGKTSDPGQFPWIISLRNGDADWSWATCGGSLITPSIVLTAAHCIGAIFIADFNRYDQADDADIQRRFFTDADIIGHEGYSHTTLDNDFALVKLSEPIENAKLIKLNADPELPKLGGLRVTAIGWGKTEFEGDAAQIQQYANMDYVGQGDCLDRFGGHYITDNMLCVYTEGVDACQGDSGGPLINMNKNGDEVLVGVVSWGSGCASTYPGVYARVSNVIEWIEDKVCGSGGVSPDDCDGSELKSKYKSGPGGKFSLEGSAEMTDTDATQDARTSCEDVSSFVTHGDTPKEKDCGWVEKKLKDERCEHYWEDCPMTCDKCDEFLAAKGITR